jgi:hypothetical protein
MQFSLFWWGPEKLILLVYGSSITAKGFPHNPEEKENFKKSLENHCSSAAELSAFESSVFGDYLPLF